MDRNREARRAGMVASSNGISRRRHRTNSLRDSPDEDVAVEFSESVRLRERVKKDRDRDRERERDRDRERERERSSRSKRRRGDDSSQESVNDDEDEEDEDTTAHVHHQLHHSSNAGGGGGVRLLPPNPSAAAAAAAAATSVTNHHHHSSSTNSHHQHHQQLQHRKTFPPSAGKPFRAAPVWKSGNEMMDVPVPRKARSVHPKRSHDWISSGSGGSCGVGDQIHRQASTSPVRQGPVSTSTPSPAPPLSPSSSNASGRRKIKANGSKQRPPPKSSSKSTSSNNPEELEIEIAEVLYGLMTQSQAPLKKEIASNDTREVNNRSCADTKSRVSSPVSGSPSPAILPSVPNSSSAAPFSAVAPKRKRPRQVSENQGSASVRSSPSSASAKAEMDQTMKAEVSSSPNFEKTPVQNGGGSLLYGLGSSINSQSDPTAEPMKVESEIKPPATEQAPESGDLAGKEEVVVSSPKKESPPSASASAVDSKAMADSVTTKPSTVSEVEEGQREEKKIQIDLMAPPPPLLRSSPEREGSATMDIKTIASESLPERAAVKHNEEDEKMEEKTVEEEKKMKAVEAPPQKRTESSSSKGKDNIGVQLDLEKLQRGDNNSKLHQHHHPLLKSNNEEHPEKANQSSSFPLPPMSLAGWPGAAAAGAAAAAAGLPPMGYMAPLQGVVTMDGSSVPTPPLQPTFSQPRPKRCATHCYIARNIHLYQQFTKMNPFWLPTAAAAAASSAASLFVSKAACNLNVVPTPADLHGNIGGRGVNSGPDNKGGHGGVAIFPGLAAGGGKDKGSQPPTLPDHPAQRKQQQILLQQALPPPIAPNNLLPGHTFIFPLNQQQQQAAAATSAARPGPAKSPANAASNASNSAATGTATTGGAPAAISFSYPNMPPNETPYLAILQNNAYFPIAAVGPPLNYRATHPPSLPMFNGSFCPSQMIHHPSQLHHHHHHHQQQQQQPQQPTPSSQSQQQMQQNTSISSGSSSSHKLLQNHQQKQRSQGGGGGGVINGSSGSGNLHNFPASNSKTHPPHQPQQLPHGRHIENELGSEDNPPSTAESQGSRVPVNMYSNQNCVMPIHPSNFNLMTPPTAGVLCATSGSGNQSEKQQQQQQGIKTGTESMQPQSFSMSFTSINGASAPGIDISSSMAQANAAIFQNFTEASRQNLHIAAAVAAAAQQPKKNYRDESRGGSGDPTTSADDERKGGSAGKGPATVGQSITFSRSDVPDASGSKLAANGIDSSRSISLASASGWTARAAAIPTSMGSNAQLQAQLQHKQQQQMAQLQMQQQHQLAAVVARSKAPPTSNGIVYSEHSNPPTSVGMKFPNTISAFPQNLVQTSSNGSPVHSPQWKGSGKTSSSSQVASTTPSSLKSISHQHQQQQQQQQQQMRIQPNHTQISFVAANQKSSTTTTSQGQHPSNSNQSQSSSMVIGSPTTTSSISKGASGSPRTTSASMSNKMDHQTPLVVQQGKASVSNPNQKSSSPASGRNVPSILGNNPHISTSSSVSKTQVQQHLAKGIQQSQLFFSSPYAQAQPSSHSVSSSSSSAPATSGYYIQTRRPEQQQPSGSTMAPTTSSTAGMLTLCPVTLGGGNTSDPAKAIAAAAAAAASNVRGGGGLPSQSILHTAQFAAAASSGSSQHQIFPAGFSYVQPPVPTVVQVKPPPEQKQPAGNDNLNACWQPEKK